MVGVESKKYLNCMPRGIELVRDTTCLSIGLAINIRKHSTRAKDYRCHRIAGFGTSKTKICIEGEYV
jgi:hypothetical protein